MKPGMHRSTNWSGAAITAVALTAAIAVVAVAARSPLSRSSPVNAQAAQGPTTAVLVLLLGFGVVMLGLLMILAWSSRRRKDDPPDPEAPAPETPWWGKLVALLLLFAFGAALVAAAISGVRRAGSTRTVGGLGLGETLTPRVAGHQRAGGFTLPSWLPWTALAIVGAAIAAVIVVLVIRRARRARETSERAAVDAAVEAAIGALDSDLDPRRAVIAAYAAMQRSLGEHGVARSPAEAPREYLQRVLLAGQASEQESTTLTGLFEEARYSSHPISEHVREVALRALRSLRGRLPAEAAK
jgi:cytochrome b561